MNSKEMAKLVCHALEEKKAEEKTNVMREIISFVLYIGIVFLLTYLVIHYVGQRTQVSGTSMEYTLSDGDNLIVEQIEGYQTANWILMDYRDVIVHIFDEENRLFYDLERIWRDGKNIAVEALAE